MPTYYLTNFCRKLDENEGILSPIQSATDWTSNLPGYVNLIVVIFWSQKTSASSFKIKPQDLQIQTSHKLFQNHYIKPNMEMQIRSILVFFQTRRCIHFQPDFMKTPTSTMVPLFSEPSISTSETVTTSLQVWNDNLPNTYSFRIKNEDENQFIRNENLLILQRSFVKGTLL